MGKITYILPKQEDTTYSDLISSHSLSDLTWGQKQVSCWAAGLICQEYLPTVSHASPESPASSQWTYEKWVNISQSLFLPITVINNKFKRYKCKTWKYMNSSIVIFDGKENHLWVRRKQMLSKSSPDLHSHLFYSTNKGEAWQVGCSGRTSKTGNTTEWFLGTGHQDRCLMKSAHSTN